MDKNRSAEEAGLRARVAEDPLNPATRNRLGDWLSSQGRTGEAVWEFRKCAEIYLRREQASRAVAILKKAFGLDPQDRIIVELLLRACRQANRPQAGAEVYFTLALQCARAGDQEGAFQMFARGVAENPGNAQRKHRLAHWAATLGKRDRAADLYLELAEFWGLRLDLNRAYRFLEKARTLRKGPKAALVEVKLLMLSGRPAEARELAQAARERFPSHGGLKAWLASQEPESDSSAAARVVPPQANLARLRQNLFQAQSWHGQGYSGRALNLVQRMLLLDPGYLPALDLAISIHQASGHLSRVQSLCVSCAKRLASLGRRPEAIICLDRLEALIPGSTIAYRRTLQGPAPGL